MNDPTGAPPHAIAADLRRLADTPGWWLTDAYRDGLRQLATEVSKLSQPATAELDAVACGLDPEQECRARAAAIVYPDLPAGIPAEAGFDLMDSVADWIRTGTRP